jgi:hypothetical protein
MAGAGVFTIPATDMQQTPPKQGEGEKVSRLTISDPEAALPLKKKKPDRRGSSWETPSDGRAHET